MKSKVKLKMKVTWNWDIKYIKGNFENLPAQAVYLCNKGPVRNKNFKKVSWLFFFLFCNNHCNNHSFTDEMACMLLND